MDVVSLALLVMVLLCRQASAQAPTKSPVPAPASAQSPRFIPSPSSSPSPINNPSSSPSPTPIRSPSPSPRAVPEPPSYVPIPSSAFHPSRPMMMMSPHADVPKPTMVHSKRLNAGKIAGIVIAGLTAFMQVAVITYLLIKRRQMLRVVQRYEL